MYSYFIICEINIIEPLCGPPEAVKYETSFISSHKYVINGVFLEISIKITPFALANFTLLTKLQIVQQTSTIGVYISLW